jgi:hypothetical protein
MDLEIVGDARDARDALNDPFEDLTLHRGTDASEQRDEALGDRDARGRHVHLRLPFDCGEDAILQEHVFHGGQDSSCMRVAVDGAIDVPVTARMRRAAAVTA